MATGGVANAMKGAPATHSGMPGIEAKLRIEELRHIKEADYWGRMPPAKKDLPAFWSVRTHGQPFNDERLSRGAVDHWQVADKPQPLRVKDQSPAGPATLCTASLRKCVAIPAACVGWFHTVALALVLPSTVPDCQRAVMMRNVMQSKPPTHRSLHFSRPAGRWRLAGASSTRRTSRRWSARRASGWNR